MLMASGMVGIGSSRLLGAGQPVAIQATSSARRHRTAPPIRTGCGALPVVTYRHQLRFPTPLMRAASEALSNSVVTGGDRFLAAMSGLLRGWKLTCIDSLSPSREPAVTIHHFVELRKGLLLVQTGAHRQHIYGVVTPLVKRYLRTVSLRWLFRVVVMP
jgi:hypothetical protein